MLRFGADVVYSASDLLNHVACPHRVFLDKLHLQTPLRKTPDDDYLQLLRKKGMENEQRVLDMLTQAAKSDVSVPTDASLHEQVERTRAAMLSGVALIHQATFHSPPWMGRCDFLRRVEQASDLGTHSYEVVEAKMAHAPEPRFVIQLTFYSQLLAQAQGRPPTQMHLELGDGSRHLYHFQQYAFYVKHLGECLWSSLQTLQQPPGPEPCKACATCPWRERCEQQWQAEDHLGLIADIRRRQSARLQAAGLHSMSAVAAAAQNGRVPGMAAATYRKLQRQAALQVQARETGQQCLHLLEEDGETCRGFRRLPRPDAGDLFFDIEGDPLHPGGLEYLLGLYTVDQGRPVFQAFWAHSRSEERDSFERFMDVVRAHLERYPNAFIYHYAPYEKRALQRLMSCHGTREDEVDALLRAEKLVDLYRVVRESMQISQPAYSIKNLEAFYMRREGEVKSGGESIVYYEKWKQLGEPDLLEKIQQYNEADCRSLARLRDWLLEHRPAGIPWLTAPSEQPQVKAAKAADAQRRSALLEERRRQCESALLQQAEQTDHAFYTLVAQLLEFHRRDVKPEYWKMYERRDASEEELIEDPECLGGLRLDPGVPAESAKNSWIHTYRFPVQETKLRVGKTYLLSQTLETAGMIEALDEVQRRLRLKRGPSLGPAPERLDLVPSHPPARTVLSAAVLRYAEALLEGAGRYAAVSALLRRGHPRIKGRQPDSPIIEATDDSLHGILSAVYALEDSTLFIQGPPGSGKTWTGARILLELLRRRKRVGVASHSHKAINNLLAALEACASESGFSLRGAKMSMSSEHSLAGSQIEDVQGYRDIADHHQLVAGTAWLFARQEFDACFDVLVIDEAGQVPLANVVAMGTSARNIVLLGDQMQLSQPSPGVHPGRSGDSVLEYLLQGAETIPPQQGIFLDTTWRMHPELCEFIAKAVYQGRLRAHPDNGVQSLLLQPGAPFGLKPHGIVFHPVEHANCSQSSEEEADAVRVLYQALLQQRSRDRGGRVHALTNQDILVVSPYNMQVNLLQRILPAGARVGTVDKFQGQEAQVVLVSMATSSDEEMPRNVEFLLSRNRLNVALSRARCLSILVASPQLLSVACQSIEQMGLVNTLCWLAEYARQSRTLLSSS